jgi:heme-degrading monooxygenase HmoA
MSRPLSSDPAARRLGRRFAIAALLATWLGGCAIATPLDMRRVRADAPPGLLQVSITHAVVDPARRAEFFRWTRRVADGLDGQPGLLAHSIRRELLGDQAWTITVWASAAHRDRFVRSDTHRRAMSEASTGIAALRVARLELPADALPMDWREVLGMLDAAPATGSSHGYPAPPATRR